MGAYVVQRLGAVMFIMVAMSILVFLATHALPSNAAGLILGQYSTPETLAALEHKLGFDQPLPVQYWHWASRMLQGDMGQSYEMERPVAPILWDAFGRSAILAGSSMAVVSTLGLALGVVASVWPGLWPDHAASIFTYFGVSLPEFYWGLVFILVFGSTFRLLPSSGYANLSDGLGTFVAHLVLPVATLTLTLLAHVTRLTRSSMIEALDSMYVKVARARGLPERLVILRHALRNALIPSITVLAQDFGFLIGGIVAVETVFAYPGLGRMLVGALERQDLPLMQAAILVLTGVYCLANLTAALPYDQMHVRDRFLPPNFHYFAGTDEYGRDVFSRLLLGSQLSLALGGTATLISMGIGVPLGLIAGYRRGVTDELIMRTLDVMLAFPPIMLVLLILAVTPPSLKKTAIAIGVLAVAPIARVTRSVTLDLMSGEFIEAARARGERLHYMLMRELLPNVWPVLMVEASLRVLFAVLLGAVLSFLGFGVQPPAADWGLMISNGRAFVDTAPWISLAPGIAMSVTVIAISLVGDGLREVLDPRIGDRR